MSARILYKNSTVAEVGYGDAASIPCKDKQMRGNLTIVNPKVLQEKTAVDNGEVTADEGYDGLSKVTVNVADSAVPIEVSSYSEMTTLLTSGEVGGVYKYTGTTGTYKNGALYVLEASE